MSNAPENTAPEGAIASAPMPVSAEQRRQLMDQAVVEFTNGGWRVESRSEFQATLVKGHRHSHLLHLLLTIFTLGLWGIVWICLVVFGGEKRRVVWVDEYGEKRGR